jgi:hypothetical protein
MRSNRHRASVETFLVVRAGWCKAVDRLTALAGGAPSSQALVVEVVEEGGQELSGRRQPGVEIPCQLVCRVVALVRGDLAQHKVKVVCSHSAGDSCSRGGDAACHPNALPAGGKPLPSVPPDPLVIICDTFSGLA